MAFNYIIIGSASVALIYIVFSLEWFYGVSGHKSIREFLRSIIRDLRDTKNELKEDKKYLKQHPKCCDCAAINFDNKAKYVYLNNKKRYAVCKSHYQFRMETEKGIKVW